MIPDGLYSAQMAQSFWFGRHLWQEALFGWIVDVGVWYVVEFRVLIRPCR